MQRRTIRQDKMAIESLDLLLMINLITFLPIQIHGMNCDQAQYDPVSNCSTHPLRIGYYASPECTSLHTLTDSDGLPNAQYARLNHPASYQSGSGTKYYEYVAGSYLTMKLAKQAQLYAIAVQGSPDNLRYFLRSFELSYKVTVNNLDVNKAAVTTTSYYKENGIIKRFEGEMKNVTKFVFANPFFSDEIRVHPILVSGNRAFRVELYGCYLGRVTAPLSISVNQTTTFRSEIGQNSSSSGSQYYLKVTEPDGSKSLQSISGSLNYTFTSRGKTSVELGISYTSGWLIADRVDVAVQGLILGLQMTVDGSSNNPYSKVERNEIEFRLLVTDQVYQMKTVHFAFGDSTSCGYNYCRKKYTRGLYTAIGTASNDMFQANQQTIIIACPNTPVTVTYTPGIFNGGIGIEYLGPSIVHNFTVRFYALGSTTYEARVDNDKIQQETFMSNGWNTKQISLPTGLLAPSQPKLVFNYTDGCETRSNTATIFLDVRISGISLRLNQTFKEQLISPVSYYFKNKPVRIYFEIAKGTTIQCTVTINDKSSLAYSTIAEANGKSFYKDHTFTSGGDTFPTISGSCSNRLNLPAVSLAATAVDFREIPEPMANFSLSLSKQIVATGESFNLNIIFLTGTGMNCTVNSSTAGISESYTYGILTSDQISYSNSRKAYRRSFSTNTYSTGHKIQVACRTVIKEVIDVISIEVQIAISGSTLTIPNFACHGTTINVQSLVSKGKPVTKELLVNSIKKLDYPSSLTKDNTFALDASSYGNPGWKGVQVDVWNDVTGKQRVDKTIRIASSISKVTLQIGFTLSSSQALPDRPYLVVPTNEVIEFNATVTPQNIGYMYSWTIGLMVSGSSPTTSQTTVPTFSRTFTSVGAWSFRLVVDGCNNVSLERNLTVIAMIADFSLTTNPTPEVVVNLTTTILITYAQHAECLTLDFGDGTSVMKNCKNNTTPHDLNCFTSGSSCNVAHVYRNRGTFKVKVTATNDLFQRVKEVLVTGKTCSNPVVVMQGDGFDMTDFLNNVTETMNTTKVLRSKSLSYNITSISINCEFTGTYSLTWRVYFAKIGTPPGLTWNDPSLLISNSAFTITQQSQILTIPCCILDYGTLAVSVEVRMTGNALANGFKTLKGFLSLVSHTDLVAKLETTKFRVYGFNTMISMNGSQSYDPDRFAANLKFSWYCRDTNLESRDISTISDIPSMNHTDLSLVQPVTGCFGQPVAKLNVDNYTSALKFNSKLLQENHTIEITLVVENTTSLGLRRTSTSKTFLVLTKETPYFEISCAENCARKMNPFSKLTLSVQCYGDACSQNPQYQWNMFQINSTQSVPVDLASLLHSFDTDKDLRMKPNALQQGMNYTLVLKGTGQGGASYEQTYSFVTNSQPKTGTCNINPSSGVAHLQQIHATCSGWTDEDLPLSYEVAIPSNASASLLCSSSSGSCSSYFPAGDHDNAKIEIRIRVLDSLKMYTDSKYTIQSYTTSCDNEIFSRVSDCSKNALRIGYYPKCGGLHALSDSNRKPNADYARLNHPATYSSGSNGTQYYEYSSGEYLTIKLSQMAHIHGISIQGSPNDTRYYLKSVDLWYKTVVNNLDVTKDSLSLEYYYSEGGIEKTFVADMANTTKFTFANPFYSDEIRIYGKTYHGDKVFRVELFGCYLGRVTVPKMVGLNVATAISYNGSQKMNSSGNQYYYNINEPNRTSYLVNAANSFDHAFVSPGKGSVELGLKYTSGWLSVDRVEFMVQGPIIGLQMLMDGYSYTPYKRVSYKDVVFSLETATQPYQIKRILFDYGDLTTCNYNNCHKTFPHGLFNVTGTAFNDFHQQTLKAQIISCPLSTINVSYTPSIHKGGVGITFLGPTVNHSLSVHYYALWTTSFAASIDAVTFKHGSTNATGWTLQVISLPAGLAAATTHVFIFNYTDACETRSETAWLFVDEKIDGLTMKINQTLKENLIEQVPYFFKNHSIVFQFKIQNGTSVQCYVSINETSTNSSINASPSNAVSTLVSVSNKAFSVSHTFTSTGDSFVNISAKCWNRLNLPDVLLSTANIEVQKIPEIMTDFTLDVNKRILNSSESFYLFLIFKAGDRMNCNVTSNSTGIAQSYTYKQLASNEQIYAGSRKAYKLQLNADSSLPTLLLHAKCRNVFNEVNGNITVEVLPVPILGLKMSVKDFSCHGPPLIILRNVTQGSPIYDSLYINSVKVFERINYRMNETLAVEQSAYGIAGWKNISLRSWNRYGAVSSTTRQVRMAMTINNLNVNFSFNLSSSQALSTRPNLTLPVTEKVDFTALVTPNASGYIYNWTINGFTVSTNDHHFEYTFAMIGTYRFQLLVDGCNDVVYDRNLTVISPIDDFNVSVDPFPESVVNKSVTVTITNARHSDCLEVDFGDGSPKMAYCKTNMVASPLNCFTPGSICRVQHVYRNRKTCTIQVVAKNGLFARSKEKTVTAKTCYDPIVMIKGNGLEVPNGFQGLSQNLKLSEIYRSSSLFYNITNVAIKCEFSNTYHISWTFYSLGLNSSFNQSNLETEGTAYIVSNKTFNFTRSTHALTIPCCFIKYGEFIVHAEVSMTGHYLIGGFKTMKLLKGFVKDTDLVAELSEKNHKLYAYNTTVTLNGSLSRDPDRYSSNLSYTWYCRDTVLETRAVASISHLPRIGTSYLNSLQTKINNGIANVSAGYFGTNSSTVAIPNSSLALPAALLPVNPLLINQNSSSNNESNSVNAQHSKDLVGCFGQPAGILDVSNTTKEISFNSMNLQGNHTMEFTLVVEAKNPFGIRKSNTSRTLLVALALTPFFELRCIDNCASKIDPTHKFSLLLVCKGGACSSTATFKWTLLQYNGTSSREVLFNDLLYPVPVEKALYMKPNVLSIGLNYTLIVRATAPDGSFFEQEYARTVNSPPENGTCTLNPAQGLAIYTTFDINCTGWEDTEQPLTYEVAHITEILTTVVCRQLNGLCTTSFPVSTNVNSTLLVQVRIVDALGMFTELYLTVKIQAPILTTAKMDNFLATIKNSTGGQKVAQFIGSVTSVLNHKAEKNKSAEIHQKSIQVRDAAMTLLSQMVNTSSDDVIAPLVAMLAEVPGEFSQGSGKVATAAIVEMTSNLLNDNHDVIFRDLVGRGKSLLAAMGMVMKSTSVNLDPNLKAKNESNSTENPLQWQTSNGRTLILNNSNYMNSLMDTVLSRMSAVETPVQILTANLGMNLEKKMGYLMNETMDRIMMGGKMTLPPLQDLNVDQSLIINSIMKMTTFNAFFWQYSSKLINSSLMEFKLKSDASTLNVANTRKPILFSIPRTLKDPLPYQHWKFPEKINEEKRNFHSLKVEHDNSLHIEFKPMNYCIDYHIYIKYGSRPSRDNYDRNWTLPDLSTCNNTGLQDVIRRNICSIYQEIVDPSLRYQVNGADTNVNCTLRELLDKRIKEIVEPCTSNPYRIYMLDSETKNGTYVFGIFEKNGSASVNTSASELMNTSMSCQVADPINVTTYFIRSYTSKCRFWDTTKENWESNGCQVEGQTNSSLIQCRCNHLTSFAADFFIAPNPIDIDKVIAGFKNIHNNVSVVVLLSLLLGFFILLVVRLRKVDKRDADKVGVVAIDNDPSRPYQYLVITVTGARINAGTTANVFVSLNNDEEEGDPRLLIDLEQGAFQRDQINAFRIAYEEPIGDITDIRIWHDNKGESPGWYLSRVYVEDLQTNKTYTFICEQWLAVELEDGLINRSVALSNQDDQKMFSHLFTTKAAQDFSDQHLWFSVFLKRPHDNFTRVQRVASCMALLFLTMLASAMFFQAGNDSKYLWKIGSLVIDYKGIIIGIQSAFVVIPVSAIIVGIFRNSESFENYKNRRKMRNADGTTPKRKKTLPCGFLVVAWFLTISAILASSVVVLFYSMQWGNDKSTQFVFSVFTGFFQSAFIIQPIKLVAVAVLIAAIFKKSQEEEDVLEMYKFSSNQQTVDLSSSEIELPKFQSSPLTEDQLKYARKRRLMEIRLRLFLQEFISYLIFLMFLVFVVRGYKDHREYNFSKALQDDIVHNHFENLQDVPGLWTWVQNHFIPAIYSKQWYNGENFTNFKMARNQEAYRIGLARIRQVRIKHGTCLVPDKVKDIVHHCNEVYSFEKNEEQNFGVGWTNVTDSPRWKRSLPEESAVGLQNQKYNAQNRLEFDLGVQRNKKIVGKRILSTLEYEQDLDLGGTKYQVIESNGFLQEESDEETNFLVGETISDGGTIKQMELDNKINKATLERFVQDMSYDARIDSKLNENRPFESDLDKQAQGKVDNFRKHPITRNEFTKDSNGASEHNTAPFVSAENSEDDIDYTGESTEEFEVLKRDRRGLKFKVKRKTIKSTSAISHTNEISIDSEYLLSDGSVRPNKDHWKYNDMSSLRGFPYYGKFATYSGGGYVASLATDIDFARAVATALEQDAWIDTLTRAVFFEFSVYNANLNFFATGFIVVELLPTGAVMPSASIRVFKLYRYVGVFGRLVMASEIILVICLFFFIYKECRQLYRVGRAYFKSFWSWVEITIAIALFAAIILRGFSWFEADKNLTQMRNDPEKFISFHYAVVADEALLLAVTIICFASTIKVIRIIAIFPTIVILKETLGRCFKPLLNYVFPFMILFCGFGTVANLIFVETKLFYSFLKTLETQLLMLIGGSVYSTLHEAEPTLGPLFFLSFAAFETVVMMNIFISIIDNSISESSDHWKEEARSNDFVEFIEERAANMLQAFTSTLTAGGKNSEGRSKPKRTTEIAECTNEVKLFTSVGSFGSVKKEMRGNELIMLENSSLVMKRFETKIIENFHTEVDDYKWMLKLMVVLNNVSSTEKKSNGNG